MKLSGKCYDLVKRRIEHKYKFIFNKSLEYSEIEKIFFPKSGVVSKILVKIRYIVNYF
jgi:hypothetical protein